VQDREAVNVLWALGKLNYKAKGHSDELLQTLIRLVENGSSHVNLLDLGNLMLALGLLEVCF
jgi:hypothetical protein